MRIEKNKLIFVLHNIQFLSQPDSAYWHLDRSGLYMYIFLNSGGIHCNLSRSVCALKIPLKVKLFLWLSLNYRILTKDNLHKRGWSRSLNCCFCVGSESVDHLFFHCPLSAQIWNAILLLYPQGAI
jgi:zinc-binding in reverse transcriptase